MLKKICEIFKLEGTNIVLFYRLAKIHLPSEPQSKILKPETLKAGSDVVTAGGYYLRL